MSLLVDNIYNYLVAQGIIEGASGWVGRLNYMPPTPDQIVAITETTGFEADGSPGTKYDEPGFQIRVRGAEFEADVARAKMDGIFNALNDVGSGDISQFIFIYAATSAPALLGFDTNNRPEFTWNFLTMRERGS